MFSFSADSNIGGSTLYERAAQWIPNVPFSIAHGCRNTWGRQLMPRHGPLGVDAIGKDRLTFDVTGNLIGFGKRDAEAADLDNICSQIALLIPSAEDMRSMDVSVLEERKEIMARQLLDIVEHKLEVLETMENTFTLDVYVEADVDGLMLMTEAYYAAMDLIKPKSTDPPPTGMVAQVLAEMPAPNAAMPEEEEAPVVVAEAPKAEVKPMYTWRTREAQSIKVLPTKLTTWQRSVTPILPMSIVHLKETDKDGRGVMEWCYHIQTENNIVYENLEDIAVLNGLTANHSYIIGAWERDLWMFCKGASTMARQKKSFTMPEGYTVQKSDLLVFQKANVKDCKACEMLLSLTQSMHAFTGTLKVECQNINELSFEDVCDFCKDMSRKDFNSFTAMCELAVHRKKASEREQVVKWMEPRLQKFMNIQWIAASTTIYLQKCQDIVSHNEIPEWFWDTLAAVWNKENTEYWKISVRDLMKTSKGEEFSTVVVGPPAANKTAVMMSLARMKCIMKNKEFFCIAGSLNDYGPLSLKGTVSGCGAACFDDVSPISGPGGGKPLTADEGKHLFMSRFATSYTAMYAPAQFPAKTCKMFTSNLEIKGYNNDIPIVECSDFVEKYPWIIWAATNNVEAMKAASMDMTAQARRAAVVYIDRPVFPDDAFAETRANDEQDMKEQLKRLEQWKD